MEHSGEARLPRRRKDTKPFNLATIEHRVHGPLRRSRIFSGGNRFDAGSRSARPCAEGPCQPDDLLGKSVPARAARGSEMEGAPLRRTAADLASDRNKRGSDVRSGCRTAALVRDDPQYRLLGAKPQYGFQKVCAVHAVNPGGAQDDVVRGRRPDRTLAGLFARSVDIQWVDLVFLAVWFAFAAIKDVIGR